MVFVVQLNRLFFGVFFVDPRLVDLLVVGLWYIDFLFGKLLVLKLSDAMTSQKDLATLHLLLLHHCPFYIILTFEKP